jgi:hypothetical protein
MVTVIPNAIKKTMSKPVESNPKLSVKRSTITTPGHGATPIATAVASKERSDRTRREAEDSSRHGFTNNLICPTNNNNPTPIIITELIRLIN